MKQRGFFLLLLAVCLGVNTSLFAAGSDYTHQDSSPSAISQDYGNAVYQRAFTCVKPAELKNQLDLHFLFTTLKTFQEKNPDQQEVFFENLRRQGLTTLKADFEQATQAVATLSRAQKLQVLSFELRTSLIKLVGDGPIVKGEIIDLQDSQGLYRSSYDLLSQVPSLCDLDPEVLKPKNRQITVLKTLFVVLVKIINHDCMTDLDQNLDLFYPASFPLSEDPDIHHALKCLKQTSFYFKQALTEDFFIPNAGFVFGGDYFGDYFRGADCSAFVAKILGLPRFSTWHLEMLWKALMNPSNQEFLQDDSIRALVPHFQAVELNANAPLELKKGDLVVWRSPSGAGHVVFFGKFMQESPDQMEPYYFEGVDLSRTDDGSVEGLRCREFKLIQENRLVYVLRPLAKLGD